MKKYVIIGVMLYSLCAKSATPSYEKITLENHILYKYDFDISKDSIHLSRALDDGKLALEDVYSFAKRHNAKAAFNAGYFHIGHARRGLPANFLFTKDNIFTPKLQKSAIYKTKNGPIKFDIISSSPYILGEKIGKIEIEGINQKAQEGIRVYTSSYWTSTLTEQSSYEIVVSSGIVQEININGNSKIPEGPRSQNFVIAVDEKNAAQLKTIEIGSKIEYGADLSVNNSLINNEEIEWMIAGSDLLIKDSKIPKEITNIENESAFRDQEFARTSLCQISNTKYSVIVADHNIVKDIYDIKLKEMITQLRKNGLNREVILEMKTKDLIEEWNKNEQKREDVSYGMSLYELASYLAKLKCKNAINLDGGGSSTLVVEGRIVNNPTGAENIIVEGKNIREVGDILYIK
ncbi:MAG: phosphodiester glycosidase family protein [Rickettsiaceae bacterium]|nr:phosphodiester glycosidase family protein [Rickettsiaceae bacterium]